MRITYVPFLGEAEADVVASELAFLGSAAAAESTDDAAAATALDGDSDAQSDSSSSEEVDGVSDGEGSSVSHPLPQPATATEVDPSEVDPSRELDGVVDERCERRGVALGSFHRPGGDPRSTDPRSTDPRSTDPHPAPTAAPAVPRVAGRDAASRDANGVSSSGGFATGATVADWREPEPGRSVLSSLFCRRCFIYDCPSHGPSQPRCAPPLVFSIPPHPMLVRPIPSYPIPSHPIPSHPIASIKALSRCLHGWASSARASTATGITQ